MLRIIAIEVSSMPVIARNILIQAAKFQDIQTSQIVEKKRKLQQVIPILTRKKFTFAMQLTHLLYVLVRKNFKLRVQQLNVLQNKAPKTSCNTQTSIANKKKKNTGKIFS